MASHRQESVRDACDRCHNKKLKCERRGNSCRKCLQSDTTCIFSPRQSSAPRAKRKKVQHKSELPQRYENGYQHQTSSPTPDALDFRRGLGSIERYGGFDQSIQNNLTLSLDDWNFTDPGMDNLVPESLDFQTWSDDTLCSIVKDGHTEQNSDLATRLMPSTKDSDQYPLPLSDGIPSFANGRFPTDMPMIDISANESNWVKCASPIPKDRELTILSSLRSISELNMNIFEHSTSSSRSPRVNRKLENDFPLSPPLSSRLAPEDTETNIDDIFCFSRSFIAICNPLLSSYKPKTTVGRTPPQSDVMESDTSSSRSLSTASDDECEEHLDIVSIMSVSSCFLRLIESYDETLDQMLEHVDDHLGATKDVALGEKHKQSLPSISVGKHVLPSQSPLQIWFVAELANELFTDLRGVLQDLCANIPSACKCSTRTDDDQERAVLDVTLKLVRRKELRVAEKIDRVIDLIKRHPRG